MAPVRICKTDVSGGLGSYVVRDIYGHYYSAKGYIGVFTSLANTIAGNQFPIPQDVKNLGSMSLLKAYAKMDAPEFNAGEFLADLEKTLLLIKDPFSSMTSLMSDVYTAARKSARFTKDIEKYTRRLWAACSSEWLAYRYGIQPLLIDISNAIDRVNELAIQYEAKVHSVRATCRFETKNSQAVHAGYTNLPGIGAYWSGVTQTSHKASSVVYYTVKSYMGSAIALGKYGLSPTQMPNLLWELFPLSFVVDWFSNFGLWLNAISPHPTVEVIACCTSYKKDSLCTCVPDWCYSTSSGLVGTVSSSPLMIRVEDITRVINPTIPVHPGLNPLPLSLLHLLDGLALIHGRVPTLLRTKRK